MATKRPVERTPKIRETYSSQVSTGEGVINAKDRNRKILSEALTLRGIDVSAGTFSHKVSVERGAKIKSLNPRAAIEVVTIWTNK